MLKKWRTKPAGFASCRVSGASLPGGLLHTAQVVLHFSPDDEALLRNMKQLRFAPL